MSFYWLGHLQAKNQRVRKKFLRIFLLNAVLGFVLPPVLRDCQKVFSLIRNFEGVKFNCFAKKSKKFEKEKTPACSASVYGLVSMFCCGDVGRVVKNGRTNPVVTIRPRSSIRQTT